jgi:membrane fusion protein, multidrug efflux system
MDSREAGRVSAGGGSQTDGRGKAAENGGPRAGLRKREIFIILGAIVVVALLIWGGKWFLYARVHESTDDARVDSAQVQVTSKIPERVDRILVETNQPVRIGQSLIVLDSTDEQVKLAQARANLDMALAAQRTGSMQGQGGISQAQAGVTGAQTMVTAAQAGVPAAQQAYDKAQADLARVQSLVSTGDLPRQQLDAARAAAAGAAAQLTAAEQKVPESQAGVSGAQGGLLTAEGKFAQASDASQVAGARALYELARLALSYTRITSPIDGYVGAKSVDVGQAVGPGVPLMTLIPNHVFITANYKETQVGTMYPGQPVDIIVDAYKGVTFHGHVLSINPASQNTYAIVPSQLSAGNFVKVTQRIPVRISIDDQRPDKPLRPGMSVVTSVLVR